jgi:hypothetical protein
VVAVGVALDRLALAVGVGLGRLAGVVLDVAVGLALGRTVVVFSVVGWTVGAVYVGRVRKVIRGCGTVGHGLGRYVSCGVGRERLVRWCLGRWCRLGFEVAW